MGSSKAPKQPDPLPAAKATAESNKQTAQYTTALDRPTQIDPYGQTTWSFNPTTKPRVLTPAQQSQKASLEAEKARLQGLIAQGKSVSAAQAKLTAVQSQLREITGGGGTLDDPLPGEWVQRTTLSPEQQRLYGLDVQAQEKAYGLGINAITAAQKAGAGGQLNMNGLPSINALNQPNLMGTALPSYRQSSVALPTFGNPNIGLPTMQAATRGIPQWQALSGNAPEWAGMSGSSPEAQRLSGEAPQWAGMGAYGVGPQIQSLGGSVPQWEELGGQIPEWQASQVGLPQNYFDQFQNQLAGMQDVGTSPTMFAQQGDQVRNALYEQMTQFSGQRYEKEEAALRNQLANQGFAVGSEGFNRELEAFRRQKDESYRAAELNSILAGGSEQSRLYSDLLAGTQSNIGRRAQQSQLDLSAYGGRQAAAAQIYGLGLGEREAAFGAGMAGRQQQFNEAQFGFGADITSRQQQEQELQNNFAQQMGLRGQQFAESQYGFGAALSARQQQEQEMQSYFGRQLGARGQQFAESQYGFDASMASRQQRLQEQQAGFTAGTQTYGLDLQNRQAMQKAQLDAYNADMMNRGMAFDANAQRYGMGQDAQMQLYQAQMQQYQAQLARQQQMYQNQAQAASWDAARRDQMIQERMLQRQVPLNEALAMGGMTGVTSPSYQPFNMSQPWQGVDYLGVQNQRYQGDVNKANAQNAQRGQTTAAIGTVAMAAAMYF